MSHRKGSHRPPHAGKSHVPSHYRALLREARDGKGRSVHELVAEARSLEDPYYVALALFGLSSDRRLDRREALAAAQEGLAQVVKVERAWRKAELITILFRKVDSWRKADAGREIAEAREAMARRLFEYVISLPDGKDLSGAIQDAAPRVPGNYLESLLERALANGGFAHGDAKAVIRAWAADRDVPRAISPDGLIRRLDILPDARLKARLLGYLHLQMRKNAQIGGDGKVQTGRDREAKKDGGGKAQTGRDKEAKMDGKEKVQTGRDREAKKDEGGKVQTGRDREAKKDRGGKVQTGRDREAKKDEGGKAKTGGQADRNTENTITPAFRAAMEVAAPDRMESEGRLETLRYLSSVSNTDTELKVLKTETGSFTGVANRARLLATLAGRADKIGKREIAKEWLDEALSLAHGMNELADRAAVKANIAVGFHRLDERGLAEETIGAAQDDCSRIDDHAVRERVQKRIGKAVDTMGIGPLIRTETRPMPGRQTGPGKRMGMISRPGVETGRAARQAADKIGNRFETSAKQGTRNHILALYNTYEGGLKSVHLRAAARAAPLCHAFDLDLLLVGFPSSSPQKFVGKVIRETGIGRGGEYLRELVDQGRILLARHGRRYVPGKETWPGVPVATTSHPDPSKSEKLESIISNAAITAGRGAAQRLCIIMGLGRKGLPASLLKTVPYHLELTGSNIPLETCTVMGIIAERLRAMDVR